MIRAFVFSIRFDSQGLPDAFMCMTPWMRADLVQFGDAVFLHAQQHQFNSGEKVIGQALTHRPV
jgi:hypothetical protein